MDGVKNEIFKKKLSKKKRRKHLCPTIFCQTKISFCRKISCQNTDSSKKIFQIIPNHLKHFQHPNCYDAQCLDNL